MMNWKHCNRCFAHDQDSLTLFLSPCSHILCDKCLRISQTQNNELNHPGLPSQIDGMTTFETKCPLCNVLTKYISISDHSSAPSCLPPEISRVLSDTSNIMEETMRIARFQMQNYDQLCQHLKSKVYQQRELLVKSKTVVSALKNQITFLNQENKRLKNENDQFQSCYQTPSQSPYLIKRPNTTVNNNANSFLKDYSRSMPPQKKLHQSPINLSTPPRPSRLSLKPMSTTSTTAPSRNPRFQRSASVQPHGQQSVASHFQNSSIHLPESTFPQNTMNLSNTQPPTTMKHLGTHPQSPVRPNFISPNTAYSNNQKQRNNPHLNSPLSKFSVSNHQNVKSFTPNVPNPTLPRFPRSQSVQPSHPDFKTQNCPLPASSTLSNRSLTHSFVNVNSPRKQTRFERVSTTQFKLPMKFNLDSAGPFQRSSSSIPFSSSNFKK